MSSPQVENGYTKIANEILERLILPGVNGSEYRVLLFVVRKTYGFNKKQDRISLSQYQRATLMTRSHVVKTIKSLVHKRILLKEKNSYIFNKNWESWVVHKRIPSTQTYTTASIQMGSKSSTQLYTHKRKKETITKETRTHSVLGAEIIKLFEEVNPACKRLYNNTTQRKACDDLIETYSFEEVSKVIAFLPKSNKLPYFPQINTPKQLWEKYQQLKDKAEQKKIEINSKKDKYKVAF